MNPSDDARLEHRISRLLSVGTLGSVALLAVGAVLAVVAGVSPLAPPPAFDVARMADDVVALRPAGFIWLGLLGTLATPASRVVAALVGYLRQGEQAMALISGLILVVIAAGVAAGIAGG
jgi:uncharacterized membrane protein